MAENPHYRELLQLLNDFEVEYLIVGGFAVMKCGEPCHTKDLDVWYTIHLKIPFVWLELLRRLIEMSRRKDKPASQLPSEVVPA